MEAGQKNLSLKNFNLTKLKIYKLWKKRRKCTPLRPKNLATIKYLSKKKSVSKAGRAKKTPKITTPGYDK